MNKSQLAAYARWNAENRRLDQVRQFGTRHQIEKAEIAAHEAKCEMIRLVRLKCGETISKAMIRVYG